MRLLSNPFAKNDNNYRCFGCSPNHANGLQMKFFEDDNGVLCKWEPNTEFEGYHNVLHGGIQATMLDEIACWTIYVKQETAGVTADMNVKYKKPVFLDKGPITITGKILESNRRLVTVKAELFDADNVLCAEADVRYFVYPEKIAREKYMYPGKEAFYL